jgi:hypothetical protein
MGHLSARLMETVQYKSKLHGAGEVKREKNPYSFDKPPCSLRSRNSRTKTLVLAGPGLGSCPQKIGAENSLVLSEFSSERQEAGLAPAAVSPALDAEEEYGEEGVKDVQRG